MAVHVLDEAGHADASICRVQTLARRVGAEPQRDHSRSPEDVFAFKASSHRDRRKHSGTPIRHPRGEQDSADEILVTECHSNPRLGKPHW